MPVFWPGVFIAAAVYWPRMSKYTQLLLGQMNKNGKLPNWMTYHILIEACLENPQLEGLGTALDTTAR